MKPVKTRPVGRFEGPRMSRGGHLSCWCWGLLAVAAFAAEPSRAAEPQLQVYPARLDLSGPGDEAGFRATWVDETGHARDVTEEVQREIEDPHVSRLSDRGLCQPVSDGETRLRLRFQGREAFANVVVKDAGLSRPPSFVNDVSPILTRFGCNQGGCHGKNAGQNGFRLSLRGYAPELDHPWIVREFSARRISLTAPADSLLLRKGAGLMPHSGGRKLEPGQRAYPILLDWITAGAPAPLKDEPRVTQLEVWPPQRELKIGESSRLLVRAIFSDGSARDVTWLTQFGSNDAGLAPITPDGKVTALRPGETALRASFMDQVSVALVTIPRDTPVQADLFVEKRNVIDEHVLAKLAGLRIEPSPGCDDATFLRRAFLDTIGTLPTSAEVRAFLADARPDKRARLIEELLQRPEFVDFWALQLADLLQNRKERDHDVRGTKGVRSFHQWLREQVAANRPWDQFARDVLTSQGDCVQNPAVGYYITTIGEFRQPEQSDVVAAVAQTFLGTRIGCAKCHNHPLERYTQDDYYHFSGYFARVWLDRENPSEKTTKLRIAHQQLTQIERQLEQAEKKRAEVLAGGGDEKARKQAEDRVTQLQKQRAEQLQRPVGVNQPRTGQFLAPQPLDRIARPVDPASDPRIPLVDWMTSPDNEFFAGAMVNRLWKHFLGTGLVEPVDDLRASNPPTNPALWKALVHEFKTAKFDLKHLMRLILNSRIYQLDSATRPGNEQDTRYYSHYQARRLSAEVLLDAICQATEIPESYPGYPLGVRAIQLPDPSVSSYFLAIFGRSERVTACACERAGDVTLPQLLHLFGGDPLAQKIQVGEGRLAGLLKSQPDDVKVAEELFLVTLGRLPSLQDQQTVQALLRSGESREVMFQDLFWALLNSKEFSFQR